MKKNSNIIEKIEAPGWDAIVATFEKIYPTQKDPLHYAPMLSWRLGGEDPLDGISVYDGGDYFHFVTFGFSELYEKESEDYEYSGYGFELTLKLKKSSLINKDDEIGCICGILQSLAKISYEDGSVFQPYEYIYTGQKTGMDSRSKSNITGFVTTLDEAGEISTPNGKVQFVQLIGVTDKELKQIIDEKIDVEELIKKLGNTLTDYKRKSLF